MGMDARYLKNSPLRRPQWRAERTLYLIDGHPIPRRPQRYDDRYVRTYRKFLVELMAAGDNELRRNSLFEKMPSVGQAHFLYVSRDGLSRCILEAWLLTGLSSDEIAGEFAMDPSAIDYFEKLFFNVRDRLDCSDWISLVIRRQTSEHSADERGGTDLGYIIRLYAFYGGPLVLRALVAEVAPEKMKSGSAAGGEIDEALASFVRDRTMAAAEVLSGRVKNARLWKMVVRSKKFRR
jgi:hypothetical protein